MAGQDTCALLRLCGGAVMGGGLLVTWSACLACCLHRAACALGLPCKVSRRCPTMPLLYNPAAQLPGGVPLSVVGRPGRAARVPAGPDLHARRHRPQAGELENTQASPRVSNAATVRCHVAAGSIAKPGSFCTLLSLSTIGAPLGCPLCRAPRSRRHASPSAT